MSTHRYIDRVCCGILALVLAVTALFMSGGALGLQAASGAVGYESRLFDTARVHTIDIVMDNWEDFLDTCENEAYAACALVIDGEAHRNVGIRAKGNTSLTSVAAYGNDRYSFKVEFDHYDSAHTYYGLDKLSLNNLIQDNTCMKDFLCYQLMGAFGVAAPLCSYVYITVNGEDWGLYLAVEGVEEAFLERNYNGSGNLYKPDSLSFGGGRGNGGGFVFDREALDGGGNADFPGSFAPGQGRFEGSGNPGTPGVDSASGQASLDKGEKPDFPGGSSALDGESVGGGNPGFPGGGAPEDIPEGGPDAPDMEAAREMGLQPPGGMGGMGSSDVKLQYVDDDPASYPNIFDNAKTDTTSADETRLIEALKALGGEDAAAAVDVDQVLRYFVVHGFVCNGDSYTGMMVHNYYLYEEAGRLSMIPWDYNLAFGGFQSGSAGSVVNEPIDTPVTGGSLEDRPMIAWIFNSQTYTELYHQLYDRFIADFFDSGACQRLIDTTSALIAPYVERDPTKFCTWEDFEAGVKALGVFCRLRAESVRGQLAGTIPSTSQGQAADSAALVDAEGLVLTDMGSMDAAGGRGVGESGGAAAPGNPEAGEAFAPAGQSDRQARPRDFQPQDGLCPGAGLSAAGWTLLGASVAVLLAGLLTAGQFRRRGGFRIHRRQ